MINTVLLCLVLVGLIRVCCALSLVLTALRLSLTHGDGGQPSRRDNVVPFRKDRAA